MPSSISDRIATLVIALVCEAMRKMVSGAILRAGFLVGPADGALVDRLAVLQHEADRAADAVSSTYCWNNLVDAREPLRRERPGACPELVEGPAPSFGACRRHGDGEGGRDGQRSQESHAQMVGSAHDASKGYIAARSTRTRLLNRPMLPLDSRNGSGLGYSRSRGEKLARIKPSCS